MGHAIYAVERIVADVITTSLSQAELFVISVLVGLMDSPSFVGRTHGHSENLLKRLQVMWD
jgi:hypothetical protein|tara:strand:- start:2508 stop:2690 length:183 start_codon:yes stop_codon:yes gene_type:complete